ncbi:MAG: pentapeptide repeat-containing protein [Alphaproteobacteria bacterium]
MTQKNEIIVSLEDLKEFNAPKKNTLDNNFHDFLKNKYFSNQTVEITPIFEQTIFEQKITLENINFEGCIFNNILFDGKKVNLKNINFAGANFINSKFINNIKLINVNFGSIDLSQKLFENADLSKAKFDPTNSNIFMYQVTNKQLNEYLKLKATNFEIGSLNDYLSNILRHRYPENTIIVADFSNKTIANLDLSNADFTGSNFTATKFKNIVGQNTVFRDCEFDNALFEQTALKFPDFRGSCLTKVTGEAVLINAKLSLSESSEIGIAYDEDDFDQVGPYTVFKDKTELGFISKNISIEGAELDPCYVKGSGNTSILASQKISLFEIDVYLKYCNENAKEIKSFKDFYTKRHGLEGDNANFIPDFSRLDLSGRDFSNSNFTKCNFAYANFAEAKLENANFEGSNFTGANLSGKSATRLSWFNYKLWGEDKYLNAKGANFNNCNLTLAKFDYINLEGAQMHNIIAKSASLVASILKGAIAPNAIFKYGILDRVNAANLQAPKGNFNSASAYKGNFHKANLKGGNFDDAEFSSADLSEADLSNASLVHTNLMLADLKKAKLKGAKLNADISGTDLRGTDLEDCDISNLFYEGAKVTNTNIDKAIPSKIREELKTEQIMQEKNEIIQENFGSTLGFIYNVIKSFIPEDYQNEMDNFLHKVLNNKKLFAFCIVASLIIVPAVVSSLISAAFPAVIAGLAISVFSLPATLTGLFVGFKIADNMVDIFEQNDKASLEQIKENTISSDEKSHTSNIIEASIKPTREYSFVDRINSPTCIGPAL